MPQVHDIIAKNLKILFIGYNPGNRSAAIGHHFAGPTNRFWKLLHHSGLTPVQIRPEDDEILLDFGFGLTNIVARPSRSAAELTREDYRLGREILRQKLQIYRPRIACYVGIGVYKQFAQIKNVKCGLQPFNVIPGVIDFVVPSPSGLNRMGFSEQLVYYQELKQLADILK